MKVITLTLLTGTAFFTLKNLNIPESQEIEDDWAPITMSLEEALAGGVHRGRQGRQTGAYACRGHFLGYYG